MIIAEIGRFSADARKLNLSEKDLDDIEDRVKKYAAHGKRIVGDVFTIRVPLPGRGTRGGARLIYAYYTCVFQEQVVLMRLYDRRKKKGLTKKETQELRDVSRAIRRDLCK